VILLVIGSVAYWCMSKLVETGALVAHTLDVQEDVARINATLADAETGSRGYVITGDKRYLEPYQAALDRLEPTFEGLRKLTEDNPRQQERLRAMKPLIADKLAHLKQVIELRDDTAKGFQAARELMLTDRGRTIMDNIREIIAEMETDENGLLEQRQADAKSSTELAKYTIVWGTLVALVLGSAAGFFIGRSITKPVREAVAQLSSASMELLTSTTQQAAGAQEQGAAVTQTLTTVNEVTQTTEQAAQRATSVGDTMQRTMDIGRSGRQAVDESVAAMETVRRQVDSIAENILALAEQAQAIGDIIATVNDIAEQTNLLALNAAIEASRAGEHGRGFSVVAAEVKALADQSKKATTQVRQILGNIQKATNTTVLLTEQGTKSVTQASQVVSQAGETIASLTDVLAESSQVAAQIAASAGQQATGMTQVHQAMKNVDQVARQNVAAIRQIEQAAHDLNTLSRRLAELLGGDLNRTGGGRLQGRDPQVTGRREKPVGDSLAL
jgi:methyl-accepting chemotaxis protein